MKQRLLAVPLSLALSLAAGHAMANSSGTIHFAGTINAGTCAIEIVDPISGGIGNMVPLGVAIAGDFPAVGTEVNTRAFGMKITPGNNCVVQAGAATVNFVSTTGPIGAGDQFYNLRASENTAKGLGVVIRDDRDDTIIAHGTNSKDFLIDDIDPTTLNFTAGYVSTAAAVTPGAVNADVNFTVNLP